jgi:murein DD-endopeptidase MepM/ murein hydrolase activator NlpD
VSRRTGRRVGDVRRLGLGGLGLGGLALLLAVVVALPSSFVVASPSPVSSASSAPAPAWLPPAQPPLVLVRGFDGPARYAPGHRGVDLRLGIGAEVRAPGAGIVRFAGPVAGRGVVAVDVAVADRGLLRFSYEPLAPLVRAGSTVRAGQVLGRLEAGHPGCRDCLHWGLRAEVGTPGERYLDPLRAGGPRPRLLPLAGPP